MLTFLASGPLGAQVCADIAVCQPHHSAWELLIWDSRNPQLTLTAPACSLGRWVDTCLLGVPRVKSCRSPALPSSLHFLLWVLTPRWPLCTCPRPHGRNAAGEAAGGQGLTRQGLPICASKASPILLEALWAPSLPSGAAGPFVIFPLGAWVCALFLASFRDTTLSSPFCQSTPGPSVSCGVDWVDESRLQLG